MMLVWVGGKIVAGAIDRSEAGHTFAYERACPPEHAVSLTMPVTLESYSYRALHPVFQMNLPEGAMREAIIRRFSKAIQGFDDLSLLELMGKSQIGRLRYSNEPIDQDVPSQSIKEILTYNGTEDLLQSLMERFSTTSGISGAQPKVMVRDNANPKNDGNAVAIDRLSVRGATHIIKAWDPAEYPELAANEFFCMTAAQRAGLVIPKVELSENGKFLVVERFDLKQDGTYLGFEDFCSLNGVGTKEKYDSSYELLARRINDFVSPAHRPDALRSYFKSFALSCAIQNGDAHLKNFGVLYPDVESDVVLSPTYDIVSTTPYIRNDAMALTLGGNKRFPSGKRLVDFGRQQCNLSTSEATQILAEIGDAISQTRRDLLAYMTQRPQFSEIGNRMLQAWDNGVKLSLYVPQPKAKKVTEDDELDAPGL